MLRNPHKGWYWHYIDNGYEWGCAVMLPEAGSAHRMLLETPVTARQYNLDGYVFGGELRELGIVDEVEPEMARAVEGAELLEQAVQ